MTDTRPVIQAGVEFAASAVTPDNPHGFLDADGRAVWRRLDKPECVPLWKERLQAAAANGCQGLLWWQPAGHVPGRPQYLVDSHLVPPDILPQFVAINSEAHKLGLWVGSLLRPAELPMRDTWDTEGCFPFRQFSVDVALLVNRRVMMQLEYGAGDAFYLDSFGLGDPDIEVLKYLRFVLGKTAPLYVEAASDRTLPYAGGYCEWSGTGWSIYGGQRDVLAELFPDRPWIAVDRTWRPFHERAEWGRAAGVAPLVLSEEIPMPGPAVFIPEVYREETAARMRLNKLHGLLNARLDARHAASARRYGVPEGKT